MPKPFPIHIDVEEVALGAVIRRLNAMPGVVRFHVDMDKLGGDKQANGHVEAEAVKAAPAKRRGRPPKSQQAASTNGEFKITGQRALIGMLKAHKTPMSLGEMRSAFEALGRSPSSVSSLLHVLRKEKMVKRTGPNAYQITARAK